MANFNIDNNSRKELIFSKERIEKDELLEDGSADLYDIIKFCCAIKENPESKTLDNNNSTLKIPPEGYIMPLPKPKNE